MSAADILRVYSVTNESFSTIISNPTSGTPKVTYIAFGATDDEVIAFSDFGLKVTIFRLSTSTSIDINSPKFYTTPTANKGYARRPQTLQCALLTRSGGKDIVSIHKPDTYEVSRSWHPDTIDAQSLSWSPDGKWLVLVESAGQGSKVLIYTADGHLYKIWSGPLATSDEGKDASLGAGVKILHWNTTGDLVAIGNHTATVTLLSTPSFMEIMNLNHTPVIHPVGSLKLWREQVTPLAPGKLERSYTLSTQAIYPPTTNASPSGETNTKVGVALMSLDASGTLIATRMENMPTTVGIWDTASKVLRVLLVQHAPVVTLTWHPSINELLLIRSEGDGCKGIVHLWEPTWDAPKIVNFSSQLPGAKIIGKSTIKWLNCESPIPTLFFSDSQDYMLAALCDGDDVPPWEHAVAPEENFHEELEESVLSLVPADGKDTYNLSVEALMSQEPSIDGIGEIGEEIDDTFHFRKFAGS